MAFHIIFSLNILTENTKAFLRRRKASAVCDNMVFCLPFTWSVGHSVPPSCCVPGRQREHRGAAWSSAQSIRLCNGGKVTLNMDQGDLVRESYLYCGKYSKLQNWHEIVFWWSLKIQFKDKKLTFINKYVMLLQNKQNLSPKFYYQNKIVNWYLLQKWN